MAAPTLETPTGSLARGLRLLELVAHEPDGIALTRLADESGLDKGTVSRLVGQLTDLGYLTRREDRRVLLTGRVLTLAHGFEEGFDLKRLARPTLWKLSGELEETVHLVTRERSRVIYVDSLRPRRETAFASIVGLAADMHVTATGRVMLYHLDAAKAEDIIAENLRYPTEPDLVFDRDDFERGRESERELGYLAIDRGDRIARVAVALLDEFQRPLASIGVFSLLGNEPARVRDLGERCRDAAAAITRRLRGTA